MGLAMSALICVTPDTVDAVVPDLPKMVRLALGFGARLRRGTLDVTLPDGRTLRLGGVEPGPSAAMTLYKYGFASRLLNGGDIGIAEAYLQGEWDTPDLTQFLYLWCVNHDLMQQMLDDNPLMRYLQMARHWFNRNTKRQARKNIYAHYDIGNAFYSAWLDPGMTYSSACFAEPSDRQEKLQEAQVRKIRMLLDRLQLKPGQRLLEIGCGWGSLAEVAARDYGVEVVGITLSAQQKAYADARMQKAGLFGKVSIELTDYRDVDGQYDAIASVEMVEAVGQDYWPFYLQSISNALKPGGRAAVQLISIREPLFAAYADNTDFIQTYIFPGGMLISEERFKRIAERAGLSWSDRQGFGLHYAETLKRWRASYDEAVAEGRLPAGFDEPFHNLWRYYLMYCEGGFRGGGIDVAQVTLQRTDA